MCVGGGGGGGAGMGELEIHRRCLINPNEWISKY